MPSKKQPSTSWHDASHGPDKAIAHTGLVTDMADSAVVVYLANKGGDGEDAATQAARLMQLLNTIAPDGIIPAQD